MKEKTKYALIVFAMAILIVALELAFGATSAKAAPAGIIQPPPQVCTDQASVPGLIPYWESTYNTYEYCQFFGSYAACYFDPCGRLLKKYYGSAPTPTPAPKAQTSMTKGVFAPEVEVWRGRIEKWAVEDNLDANMIASHIEVASCGNSQATRWISIPNSRYNRPYWGLFAADQGSFYKTDNPWDPDINALRADSKLARMLEYANGNFSLAEAYYYGYPNPSTESVELGKVAAELYTFAKGGPMSDRLKNWLVGEGTSLCHQAHITLESQGFNFK